MTFLIIANGVLLIGFLIAVLKATQERINRNIASALAHRREREANEALAHASKVECDNNDLRARLGEQGKAWAAKLRKQQNHRR